jgi:hypothetical protein
MNSTPLFIMWVSKHCCFWKKARVCCEHGENVRCQPLAPAHSNYSYPPKQLSKIDLTSITYYGSRLLSAFWDCPCYWTLKREWTHRSFAEFAHGWGGGTVVCNPLLRQPYRRMPSPLQQQPRTCPA